MEKIYNKIKKIDFYFLLLLFLTVFICSKFICHSTLPLIDIGRELYFPQEILNGKVLYKDIFNLFGPFSYLFNALLYKIVPLKTFTVVKIIGYMVSILYISGIYSVSKKLFEKFYAFIISLFSIIIGVASVGLFSYTMPYAISIMYGAIAFIWSIYFFITSAYNNSYNYKKILISVLLGGIAVFNKYEFLLYGILLLCSVIQIYRNDIKRIISILLSFFSSGIVCYGYLILSGLNINDLINAAKLIKTLVKTPAYVYYYTSIGTIYSNNTLLHDLKTFLTAVLFFGIFYIIEAICKKNKILGIISGLTAIPLILQIIHYMPYRFVRYDTILSFLPIAAFIMFIIKYRNLDKIKSFLVMAAICVSYKLFWSLNVYHYGTFLAPTLIIAYFSMLKTKRIKIYATILLLTFGIAILVQNIECLKLHKYEIKTEVGTLYTSNIYSSKINGIISYINKNTKPDDTIIIYPSGLTINYLTGRKADPLLYQYEPAYGELFSERAYIDRFKELKPEYFILANKMMTEHNHLNMCETFAEDFCEYIKTAYKPVYSIYYLEDDKEPYRIYKRK